MFGMYFANRCGRNLAKSATSVVPDNDIHTSTMSAGRTFKTKIKAVSSDIHQIRLINSRVNKHSRFDVAF